MATPSRGVLTGATSALVTGVTFGVYLRTMYPGLVAFGDSPKLQFVGRIWGTPHNPGYPLYIVVSHAFGWLPIGTLAYRINLMSAVFGAVAAGLMVMLVSRLTGRVWAGITSGFGLGFGAVFWSQAIVAEVYALASALLLAATYFAARWTETRRDRDLVVAVLLCAVAVGNHLTIVMFAPGLVVLVVLCDWRKALRPRMVAGLAALVVAGLAQYLLIIYLTKRQAPYLESSAHNLAELLPVMMGSQFDDRFGHFGWRQLFTSRSADLLSILRDQMSAAGLAVAAAGLMVLIRRQRPIGVGLMVSALCVWIFVLTYDITDPQVFLIPVIVVLWIYAGIAAGALLTAIAARNQVAASTAGVIMAVGCATSLYAANHRVNDHHHRTYEARMMDAIFRALPSRAGIVPGTFAEQLMLEYKLFGEQAGAGRSIVELPRDSATLRRMAQEGTAVYVMPEARAELDHAGFLLEPVPLPDVTLKELLTDLPPNLVVAIAGLGIGGALPPRDASFHEIGARTGLFQHPRYHYAAIGVSGTSSGALEHAGDDGVRVEAEAVKGPAAGRPGLPKRLAAAAANGGTIEYDGRPVISSEGGAVVAVFTADGHVVRASALDRRSGLRLSFAGDPVLFRVNGFHECRDIANQGWIDISPLAAGHRLSVRVDNYRPFDSRLSLVLGRNTAARAELISSSGPGRPAVSSRLYSTSDAAADLRQALAGIGAPVTLPPAPFVELLELRVNDEGEFEQLSFELGAPAAFAVARGTADLNNPRRLSVCGGDSM